MLAVSTDNFTVQVIDCDIKRLVRKFNCHKNIITDMVENKCSILNKICLKN